MTNRTNANGKHDLLYNMYSKNYINLISDNSKNELGVYVTDYNKYLRST